MAFMLITPFGTIPFGMLPVEGNQGALVSGPATMEGAAIVRVAAKGVFRSGRATGDGDATVRIDVASGMHAERATMDGSAFARLIISGDLVSGPATMGGLAKPPPLELAAKAPFGAIHLVEMEALQRGLTRHAIQLITPFGYLPFGMLPDEHVDPGIIEFAFSDKGYASPPYGTKASTLFLGQVNQALAVARTMPVAPEASRRVNLEFGDLTIANSDGSLDYAALQYAIDGRKVVVKLGLDGYVYDDFKPVFTGRSVSWTPDFQQLTVQLRDQSYLLDIELHPEFYDGTGGYNGTAQLAGKPRPDCFGKCLNVSPVFLDPANLIYQFHRREAEAVDAVYDRGVALTFGADHADYATLVAATIAGGHYDTCLALGLIRLGSSPSLVTADVRGDAAGSYIDTTSAIAQRLLTDYGSFDSDDLDAPAWTAFATLSAGTIGWYSSESIFISEALSEIIGGCCGWWGADFTGKFGAFILSEPDPTNVVFEFDESYPHDINRLPPPSGTFPPRWRQRVGYQRNWTPMSGEDIAGAVSDSRKAFLTEQYRIVSARDDDIRSEFLTAMDPPSIGSLFDSSSDAQAMADRLLDLFGSTRETIQFSTGLVGYLAPVGATSKLRNRRVANGNGKLMRVIVSQVDAASQQITLVLWG